MKRVCGLQMVLAVMLMSFLLSGCFTGIESTPKITVDDVKKEKVIVTAEQLFLDSVKGEPFRRWQRGKMFFVTDNKIRLIFGTTADQNDSLAGKMLEYDGYSILPTVTGEHAAELRFISDEGKNYSYRIGVSLEELNARETVELPFAIEMTIVETVRKKMSGQKYYVLTSVWYDTNDEISYGRKFIPVTIAEVMPGNNVYPVKLAIKDSECKEARLFMSVGRGYKSPRSFATLFSFSDPRLKYPDITDDVWKNIISGQVSIDMTREECRLSLGAPKEIDRRPGYNGVSELWLYENGAYLVFVDGLLREFRNTNVKRY